MWSNLSTFRQQPNHLFLAYSGQKLSPFVDDLVAVKDTNVQFLMERYAKPGAPLIAWTTLTRYLHGLETGGKKIRLAFERNGRLYATKDFVNDERFETLSAFVNKVVYVDLFYKGRKVACSW